MVTAKTESDFTLDPDVTDAYSERVDPPIAAARAMPRSLSMTTGKNEFLYLDIETVPDWSRVDDFNLPPVVAPVPETPAEEMVDAAEVLSGGVAAIKQCIAASNPHEDWLTEASMIEAQSAKPRKGVQDAIAAGRRAKRETGKAESDRIKLLSTTPEYCRIVAAAGATSRTNWFVSASKDEPSLLNKIWKAIGNAKQVVTYNGISFDLPVILYRSAIHKIDPPCFIDLRKYGNRQVLDLYQLLFASRNPPKGTGGLKAQCKLAGITVDSDCDGSKVNELFEQGEFAELKRYVLSDVTATQDLHKFYRGYYWD